MHTTSKAGRRYLEVSRGELIRGYALSREGQKGTPENGENLYKKPKYLVSLVGARGFEPPTPCSQGRCADQSALRPDPNLSLASISLSEKQPVSARPAFLHRLDLRPKSST